jgi:signal transduction histidine kinase/CheY-like chemotaxis protein
MESIGVVLNTIESTSRTESLLTQSQSLAQELQQTNQELAEKARLLSEQNFEVEQKNREVEQAKLELEDKATQLALSSKYKSEFLANMSHELRTPLNSLLILAQQLSENPDSNLSESEVEFAKTIHGSGTDLLTLINDILDLAKIESGTVTLEVNDHRLDLLREYVERTFKHMAELKKIEFNIRILESTPKVINTDITRLQQILKNLLSNAFKFTSQGKVSLTIGLAKRGWTHDHPILSKANGVIAFSVEDSGVGIAADKLQLIFEAFQQADGSTARKYGGTGLGLSISRELARLLTGEIHVSSKVGEGSVFTLFLPLAVGDIDPNYFTQNSNGLSALLSSEKIFDIPEILDSEVAEELKNSPIVIAPPSDTLDQVDDRSKITSSDNSVLIIEGNPEIAIQLMNQTRELGFKGIITFNGDSALSLARDYLPIAIFLDVDTLGFDGYIILDRLKRDLNTRNIPVHIISNDKNRETSLRKGAISHLTKPLTNEMIAEEFSYIKQFIIKEKRNLLIIEDDEVQRNSLIALIGNDDIIITAVETGQAALESLAEKDFDCVVLDLTLPDIDGLSLLEKIGEIKSLRHLPIIIYTAKDLNRKDLTKLNKVAKTIVVKDARSPERLFNETALYLHRSYTSLSKNQQQIINQIYTDDHALSGKRVLIVDDDIRNIFALSSVLEKQEMTVMHAENGKTGIEVLENNPDIEIVLMDIMMPEMDGYDTMKVIRKIPKFKNLPIITLTAKAMKGDRDKCIAAGASDYITKPVDVAKLLSMMRTWLYR